MSTKMSAKTVEKPIKSLKVLWLEPEVQFNGKGIITVWRESLEKRGWDVTRDVKEVDSCDLVFFGSDSQLRPSLIGKKPTICFFWGWPPKRFLDDPDGKYAESIWEKVTLLRACTRILVPSPNVLDQLRMLAGIDEEILPVGIDTEWIDAVGLPKPVNQRKSRVMFCSRLVDHKNLDMLIQAMSMIENNPLRLVVCGPGDTEPYRKYADQLGVKIFFQEPGDSEKMRMMKESLIFVHPSEYEGWGLPPMEAIYNGCITLLLDTPHNRWVFKDGATYFYNAQDLAVNIANILGNEAAFKEAFARTAVGREWFRLHGNLNVVCESLWAHFHQTIKQFLAQQLHDDPTKWAEIYDAEHRRNWAYAGETSPKHACGPARFDPTWARHWRAQYFLAALKETQSQQIIDIGCGPVYPTIFAREGIEVYAIDISTEAIEQVKAVAEKWGVDHLIHAEDANAHLLPYQDSCFDAAVIGELLEHVPDPENILAEAIRVVKPGGIIIASTPIGRHHYDPMHMQIFDDESMQELCSQVSHIADLMEISKVAEDGCDPSCYLIVLKKK